MDSKHLWYFKLLERCRLCFSCARIQRRKTELEGSTMRFHCAKCSNEGEWGLNEGVALCNWNRRQREIKMRGEPDGPAPVCKTEKLSSTLNSRSEFGE